MKHPFRQHTTKGFSAALKDQLSEFVSIEHYGSEQRYEFPLKWDTNGISEMAWTIPREAKLGFYDVRLLKKAEKEGKKIRYRREGKEWASGRFS